MGSSSELGFSMLSVRSSWDAVIANKSKTPGKEKNNQGVNTGEKKKKNE